MPGKPVLLAEGYLGFATVLPGLYMSPPLLPELRTPLGVFILCSFHAAQYVSSTGCLPGGVKLTLTKEPLTPNFNHNNLSLNQQLRAGTSSVMPVS